MKEKMRRVNFWMPFAMMAKLEKIAVKRAVSVAHLVRDAVIKAYFSDTRP